MPKKLHCSLNRKWLDQWSARSSSSGFKRFFFCQLLVTLLHYDGASLDFVYDLADGYRQFLDSFGGTGHCDYYVCLHEQFIANDIIFSCNGGFNLHIGLFLFFSKISCNSNLLSSQVAAGARVLVVPRFFFEV